MANACPELSLNLCLVKMDNQFKTIEDDDEAKPKNESHRGTGLRKS
tara:strand:- start:16 stop:153 length:138 start_codon:yes stop_codon:yes gene_type:complete